MTSKIETELQKATGIKPKPGQERAKYLDNLSAQADKISDEKFQKLSAGARTWINAASDAVNAEKPVPDFEDDGSADDTTEASESKPEPKKGSKTKASKTAVIEESDDSDDAGATEEDEDVASKKNGKAAPKTAKKTKEPKTAKPAKAAKAAKPPKEKKARGNGKLNQMKALILDHPEDSAEQLTERLAKKGITLSKVTVSTVRSDFRSTVAFLVEKGLMKSNPFVTK